MARLPRTSMPETPPPQVAPSLFDRALIARRRARTPTAEPDFVTALVIGDLRDRLSVITRRFERAVILGPEARFLPETLASAEAPVSLARVGTLEGTADGRLAPAVPPDCDLIVSLLELQIIDDVPAYLAYLRHHLRPDGLFIAAALGGNSLTELRQAWLAADAARSGGAVPRVAPMLDVRDAGRLLQHAGLALPVTDTETRVVRYPDPLALMRELRTLGASNPLRDRGTRPATRALLADAVDNYVARASDPDGRIRATLEIIWMSGWAPDASQPKPLAPGTARMRLADVLKDKSGN